MKKFLILLFTLTLATCWVSCSDDDDKNEPDPTIPTMNEITLTIKVDRNNTFSPFDTEYFDEEEDFKKIYGEYLKIPQDLEINWGDGQTTNSTSHKYDVEGTYHVIIKGTGITSIICDGKSSSVALEEIDVTKAPNNESSSVVLEEIDVTNAPDIVILDVMYQHLKKLDLSKTSKLRYIQCESNELSSLDLSKNIALESLQCMANNLTSLDLSKNTKLIVLECSNNQLTSLDVSKNPELTWLSCKGNQFTQESVNALLNSLPMGKYENGQLISFLSIDDKWDVSIAKGKGWEIVQPDDNDDNTNWQEFRATFEITDPTKEVVIGITKSSTNFSIIDWGDGTIEEEAISFRHHYYPQKGTYYVTIKGKKIDRVEICNSQMTSLDLSELTELTDLSCYNNQLTSLDVSKNTELTYLDCRNNPFTQESVNALLNSLPMGKYENGHPSELYIDAEWDTSIAEEKGWIVRH